MVVTLFDFLGHFSSLDSLPGTVTDLIFIIHWRRTLRQHTPNHPTWMWKHFL